jgi:hypothetical protein
MRETEEHKRERFLSLRLANANAEHYRAQLIKYIEELKEKKRRGLELK